MNKLVFKDEVTIVISFLNIKELSILSLVSKKFHSIINKDHIWFEQCLNFGKFLLKLSHKPPPIEEIIPKFDNRDWKKYLCSMKRCLFVCGSNVGPKDWGVDKMPKEKDYGQLGIGLKDGFFKNLTLVPFFIGKKVKEIATGGFHSLVLTENDELYSFGSNAFGQLGLGDRKSRDIPTKVAVTNIKSIACGYAFSAVITNDGKLITWGFNKNGRCGHSDEYNELTEENKLSYISKPTVVKQFEGMNITQMACGSGHMIVLDDQGNGYTFGRNDLGQLGVFDSEKDELNELFILNLKHNNQEYQKRILEEKNLIKVACTSYSSLVMDKKQLITIFQYHTKKTAQLKRNNLVKGGGFFCFSETGFLFDYQIPFERNIEGWNGLMNNTKDFSSNSSCFVAVKQDGSLYYDGDEDQTPLDLSMKVPIIFERIECGNSHHLMIGDIKSLMN